MTITDNQIKGNWGEQYVASHLASSGCLIRHVTQGHDTGIDLYCESTFESQPDLHFWVQVKTSQEYAGKSNQYSYAPPKTHIKYWLNQPIPVFIFLVPDLRGEANIPFYICSALDFLQNANANSFLMVNPGEDQLSLFLDQYLPHITYRWYLKEGIVAPLNKGPRSSYTRIFPEGFAQDHERDFYVNLRRSLWHLSGDILMAGNHQASAFEQAKPYLVTFAVLNQEKPDLHHYETFNMLGMLAEAEKDCGAAQEYYEIAVNMIEGDDKLRDSSKTIPGQAQIWSQVLSDLREQILRVNKLSETSQPDVHKTTQYSFLYLPIRKPPSLAGEREV
jgi:Domain of unknown function (DUF4365)